MNIVARLLVKNNSHLARQPGVRKDWRKSCRETLYWPRASSNSPPADNGAPGPLASVPGPVEACECYGGKQAVPAVITDEGALSGVPFRLLTAYS